MNLHMVGIANIKKLYKHSRISGGVWFNQVCDRKGQNVARQS